MLRNEAPGVPSGGLQHVGAQSPRGRQLQPCLITRPYSSVNGVFPTPPGLDLLESFLPMMIMMDPPRHDQLRALVSRAFTPRRVAALGEGIEQLAERPCPSN